MFELIGLIILFLIFWGMIRFLGMVFNGPRHRRRKMRRYLMDDLRVTQDIYENMRRAHYDRRHRW